MTAPINDGDIWITQSINAPYVDPEYTYPASVLGMTPAPAVMFRLETAEHLTVAVEEIGNCPVPGDNLYRGFYLEIVDGYTICDCGKAMDCSFDPWGVSGGLSMQSLPPFDHWDITVVFEVELTDLSDISQLWHMGDTISGATYGLECIAQTDGRLAFRYYSGSLRTVQTTDPVFTVDVPVMIGFNGQLNSIRIYVDGQFVETLALPVPQVQSTEQKCALGGKMEWDVLVRGFSSGIFDELIMWNGALNNSDHLFVYDQLHAPCSVSGNCVWGHDPTWDAKNSTKDPGELQSGDIWIVEE